MAYSVVCSDYPIGRQFAPAFKPLWKCAALIRSMRCAFFIGWIS
jgi:hypothetical protein